MEDKSYYKRLFPLLNDYHLINNSETDKYNCISHTLNIKNISSWPHKDEQKFYWPVKRELSIEAFDEFYKYHGFIKLKYIDDRYDKNILKVGLYIKDNIPTHACVQINERFWQSKIGELGVIVHDLYELESNVYGAIKCIYVKKKSILKFNEHIYYNSLEKI